MSKNKKLSKDTINIIKRALLVATVTKTEELLFDEFGISGRSLLTDMLIIQPLDYDFEFTSLGIGNIPALRARLNLMLDEEDVVVEFEEPANEPDSGKVFKLIFRNKKTKIEFRCTAADKIKTKKTMKDPIFYYFNLNQAAVKFMTTGCQAMNTNVVQFDLNAEGQLYLKLIDKSSGDVLEHLVTDTVKTSDDCDSDTFSFAYGVPRLAPLLKTGEDTKVALTRRGALNLTVENYFSVYLIPEIN